jgi:streptomycin 6-kinase
LIRRGTVSVVMSCRAEDGARLVLKLSPDRSRIASEGEALAAWRTPRTPRVIARDPGVGALLLEAIEPGLALDQSDRLPSPEDVGSLVMGLHQSGPRIGSVPTLTERVRSLFDAGEANYVRRPDLSGVVPRGAYDRGRRAASALAAERAGAVVLHGDLTPANVLDGGAGRGLVAIDPAPCAGDPAFDPVDLLMWRATDMSDLVGRAERVGAQMGLRQDRLLEWCAAFSAMTALEEAEASPSGAWRSPRLRMLLDLSAEA